MVKNLKMMNATDHAILLKSILESTTEYAIFAIDLNRCVLIWNEGARHHYGYTGHEILHKNSEILYDPIDITSGKINAIYDVVLRKGSWSGELKVVAKAGAQFNALVNISLCKDLKGKVIGYTLIVRDLTELQNVLQIMSKLKESERILQMKNEELNEKILEAKAANRLKNEFVANMSHELRTPLNGIIGFSQMILKGKVGAITEKQNEYQTIILNSANLLLFLINDLLDLAKISSGKMEFNPENINVVNFMESIREFFKAQLLKKNLQLTICIDPNINEIVVDPVKLKQIVNNYLSNAIKFTPEGGEITVNISLETEDTFRLEVQDSGIGVQEEDIQNLFTEFQQLSHGQGKIYPGTGLGLALTRKLAELQGGQVGVRSNYGKGSTFYVVLPIAANQNKVTPTMMQKALIKPNILVIEEESQQRDILLEAQEVEGFNAEFSNDITTLLKGSRDITVDAIILDFFLSDINNWRVLKALYLEKENGRRAPILVLVIALEAGNFGFRIQDFLIKPIVPENLILALERAGAGPHQFKSILILDDDKKILSMAKKYLSDYEYNVICKSSKHAAFTVANQEDIHVIIVNILMSGMEGLDFLLEYQRSNNKKIPIIIWRADHIDDAELSQFKNRVQQMVLKETDVSRSLLREFEGSFSVQT